MMTDDHSALRKTDISSCVEACFRSFEEIQSTSEYASHDLGTKLARFRSWVGNIGGHHRDQQSVDSRMRKIPHIRDEIRNILEVLQETLADGRYTHTSFYQLCSDANKECKACAIIRREKIPWDKLSISDSDSDLTLTMNPPS
jgi:predicted transcriptional regulator